MSRPRPWAQLIYTFVINFNNRDIVSNKGRGRVQPHFDAIGNPFKGLKGFDRIEDTVSLRDKYISVIREEAVELEEGEYYVADLIGCVVFDENGLQLGTIYDVINTGSNDVYWIKDHKNKDILVPVLKEIVISVDIDSEKIIIKPIKEWMDE